jgi:site-specific DNA recombinase
MNRASTPSSPFDPSGRFDSFGPSDPDRFDSDRFDSASEEFDQRVVDLGRALTYEEIIESVGDPEPRRFSPAELAELKERSRLLPKPGEELTFREPNKTNPRMCIYERRSKLTAASVSLSRQRKENWLHIQRLGGRINLKTDVFYDDNVSASGGKYRYGIEMMLEQIEQGRFDGVVVWELPRALRNRREANKFRDILLAASCEFYVVSVPSLSLSGPGAFLFDAMVDQAVKEVELISLRSASYQQFMREVGAATSIAVFGMKAVVSDKRIPGRSKPVREFVPDLDPRPELDGRSRGQLVLEAADAVLKGESVTSVARRWNDAGFGTRRAPRWSRTTLKGVLTTPTLAGLAHYKGSLLDVNRQVVPAGAERVSELAQIHEGLFSVHDWLRLQEELERRRVDGLSRGCGRRSEGESLLHGVLVCGGCDTRMVSSARVYACRANQGSSATCATGNCVTREHVDRIVTGAALYALSDPERRLRAAAANEGGRQALLEAAEQRCRALVVQLQNWEQLRVSTTARDTERREWFAGKRREVEEQLAQARGELVALHQRTSTRISEVLARAGNVEQDFAAMDSRARNTLMREVFASVVIRPALGRRGPFDPSRITLNWKEL